MMRKIKIAQIGIGHDHAEGIFDSLKRQAEIFDIVGYAVPEDEESGYPQKDKFFEGYKKLTVEKILSNPDIEAVTIETEEKNLAKYALMAAESNKHIHMDKPGGMSLSEFEKLISVVKERNLILHLGYMYRYNPEISQVLEQVKSGAFGEIFSVEGQMGSIYPQTPEKRQWLKQFKGGMMFFLGCHMIDMVLQCMGKPENIIPFNKSTGLEDVDAEDFSMAVFEYKNGTAFVKNCAREVGAEARRQLVICGSETTVEIKPLEYYKAGKMYTDVSYSTPACVEKHTSEAYRRYDRMMASFAKMTVNDTPNPESYDYELLLYKCVLKACGYNIQMREI